MREALLYDRLDRDRVRCGLCAHECLIRPGDTGICGVRRNESGRLVTLVYGRAVSANVDPIEKKPLFHFLPGTTSLSMATVGCNFSCRFCQNSDISMMPRDQGRIAGADDLPPEDLVSRARRNGAASISYTYTEPTVFFEYALDTARLATRAGLKNVFVTNGYMSRAALETLGSNLHAANVDLKAFTDSFYKELCGARLEPVMETIVRMKSMGVWVEVTTLLIPGRNDDETELTRLAEWLAGAGTDIPWHISCFRPTYRLLDVSPTSADDIHRALEIGRAAGLRYVYAGNLWGDEAEKTHCHQCGTLLIDRRGFSVRSNRLLRGACPNCSTPAAGVWE
ncbi:MAG: AmmeMemoRadiSam system radical SAM enzyme [Proteobacteria bacterium]|nr:AmmeMemoRadiSam system radical SAM enzyme [Pseudomonadota bacterium]